MQPDDKDDPVKFLLELIRVLCKVPAGCEVTLAIHDEDLYCDIVSSIPDESLLRASLSEFTARRLTQQTRAVNPNATDAEMLVTARRILKEDRAALRKLREQRASPDQTQAASEPAQDPHVDEELLPGFLSPIAQPIDA